MAGYICSGTRIADSNRSWQATENTNVTDWDINDEFIFAFMVYTQSHSPPNETLRLEWRDDTDNPGGAFTALGATGELKYGSSTVLTDGGTLSTGNFGCTVSYGNYDSGWELEGSNSHAVQTSAKQRGLEIQVAISPNDADQGNTYSFQIYDVTTADAVSYGDGTTAAVTITMAAAETNVVQSVMMI